MYKLIEMILHVVLEADDGPELDISIGGVLDTRLVVNPINDAFGIPEKYLMIINKILKCKLIKYSNAIVIQVLWQKHLIIQESIKKI